MEDKVPIRECGILIGGKPPCALILDSEGRCSRHCRRKLRGKDRYCRKFNIKGRKGCRLHGGRSRAGAMHGNFKTGEFSEFLPARFGDLYKTLEGKDILDLSEDIRVLMVRMRDVAKRVDAGESGQRWREAQNAFEAFAAAQSRQDRDGALDALSRLRGILRQGVADWQAWEKIEDLILKRTKVVESQRKRAVEAHEMLAAQEARAMMRAITEGLKRAVEENVTDADLRRRIFTAASSEFTRLVNPGRVELVSSANN